MVLERARLVWASSADLGVLLNTITSVGLSLAAAWSVLRTSAATWCAGLGVQNSAAAWCAGLGM
jgi:hypothetical protein